MGLTISVEVLNSRLKKTFDYLREEPRRLDMDEWGTHYSNEAAERNFPIEVRPPCGTVCCFAGGVCLANAPELVYFDEEISISMLKVRSKDIPELALELLGLDEVNMYDPLDNNPYDKVFFVRSWPLAYAGEYRVALTRAARVEVLADYIKYFFKSEFGVEVTF